MARGRFADRTKDPRWIFSSHPIIAWFLFSRLLYTNSMILSASVLSFDVVSLPCCFMVLRIFARARYTATGRSPRDKEGSTRIKMIEVREEKGRGDKDVYYYIDNIPHRRGMATSSGVRAWRRQREAHAMLWKYDRRPYVKPSGVKRAAGSLEY